MVPTRAGTEVKVSINPDNNPQAQATELAAKKFKNVVEAESGPAAQVHVLRRAGSVSIGWVDTVRVRCPPKDQFIVECNPAAVESMGITEKQKSDVQTAFAARSGSSSRVGWES